MSAKTLAALILTLLCAAACTTLRTAPLAPAPSAPYMGDNYQLILIATCGHERDSST